MRTLYRTFLLVVVFPFTAFAQDIPAPPGLPNPDENAMQFVNLVLQLVQQGKWLPALMLGLFLAVWAFRKWGLKLVPGAAGEWLRSKPGGYAINFVFALLGGFGGVTYAGAPLTLASVLSLVMAAVTFAFGASGLNELWKDLKPAPKVPETLPEAVSELNKVGPQP